MPQRHLYLHTGQQEGMLGCVPRVLWADGDTDQAMRGDVPVGHVPISGGVRLLPQHMRDLLRRHRQQLPDLQGGITTT